MPFVDNIQFSIQAPFQDPVVRSAQGALRYPSVVFGLYCIKYITNWEVMGLAQISVDNLEGVD